mmetsp:Transcript_12515/g.48087  ORF Transcript_12515/g.48087 Transcript_12515/m.48087 type:complete len:324 (+) Transcript_12515:1014-1985(+)
MRRHCQQDPTPGFQETPPPPLRRRTTRRAPEGPCRSCSCLRSATSADPHSAPPWPWTGAGSQWRRLATELQATPRLAGSLCLACQLTGLAARPGRCSRCRRRFPTPCCPLRPSQVPTRAPACWDLAFARSRCAAAPRSRSAAASSSWAALGCPCPPRRLPLQWNPRGACWCSDRRVRLMRVLWRRRGLEARPRARPSRQSCAARPRSPQGRGTVPCAPPRSWCAPPRGLLCRCWSRLTLGRACDWERAQAPPWTTATPLATPMQRFRRGAERCWRSHPASSWLQRPGRTWLWPGVAATAGPAGSTPHRSRPCARLPGRPATRL